MDLQVKSHSMELEPCHSSLSTMSCTGSGFGVMSLEAPVNLVTSDVGSHPWAASSVLRVRTLRESLSREGLSGSFGKRRVSFDSVELIEYSSSTSESPTATSLDAEVDGAIRPQRPGVTQPASLPSVISWDQMSCCINQLDEYETHKHSTRSQSFDYKAKRERELVLKTEDPPAEGDGAMQNELLDDNGSSSTTPSASSSNATVQTIEHRPVEFNKPGIGYIINQAKRKREEKYRKGGLLRFLGRMQSSSQ